MLFENPFYLRLHKTHRNHRIWWPCDFPGDFQGKLKKTPFFQEFPGGSQISRSFQECGNPAIIRTGLTILVELTNLVNSVIIFLPQMTLLRWLTFLLGSRTVILIVLLSWIYWFILMPVLFCNGFLSIGKFWSCCCHSFHWLSIKFTTGCRISLHSLWLFSCWFGQYWWSFERCPMGGYL